MNYLHGSILNIERDDLRLKLTNLQLDICDLLDAHQHPSFPLKIIQELKVRLYL